MIADFETYFIEPIEQKDAWKLCDFITINSDRLKYFFPVTLERNLTPTLSQIFVEEKAREFARKEEFLFKLKEKAGRTIIGLVYIKELDWKNKKAELAYCIGYQYEKTGIMTQAVQVITNYALNVLGLKKLQIVTHKSNIGSVKVAKKCGYIWKGVFPKMFHSPIAGPMEMELYELSA